MKPTLLTENRLNPRGLPLLRELLEFQVEDVDHVLVEDVNGKSTATVIGRGVFGMVDVPTANGRVYSRSLMERECNRLREQIADRKVFGELDHPSDGKTLMSRVALIITELTVRDDGVIYGSLEVIPGTPNGKTLLGIIESKGKVGVSSRGFGTTTKDGNGNDVVNDDYTLATFDAVGDPAAASAYPEFTVSGSRSESRSIGESRGEGRMTLTEMKTKDPVAYAALVAEARMETAGAIEEARKAGKAEALVEAKKEVEALVPGLVKEAREKITTQLEKDPKVAGALGLMEQLKPLLAPFIVGGDAATALAAKDTAIAESTTRISTLNKDLLAVKAELAEALRIGKRALLTLHVERRLGDQGEGSHPCSVQLRTLMGSIDESMTMEQVNEKLEKVAGSLLEERMSQRTANAEIVRLRTELEEAKSQGIEAGKMALQIAVAGYASKVCSRHTASERLEEAIMARNPRTKGDVDVLFDELSEAFKRSPTLEAVRRGIGSGSGGLVRRSRGPEGANNGDGLTRAQIAEERANGGDGSGLRPRNKGKGGTIGGVQMEAIQKLAGMGENLNG